ncbi:hypothetical protein I5M27_17540 [Adhaeribacter sp. BT258]|uniref:DUF4251 domain-containing protein n=1 Tax=Adhaeribacter terrigena TaxID=2793070 RepID=A0ABS1C606_9BACT|nr:hypothetical protein [Adhaeribacter terrigena]MBK0404799.1 hypothetical protein [Adhaeribacter terrigena]
MNRFLTIIIFLLISVCSFGQNENQNSGYLKMSETDSLYLIAMEKYTIEIDSFYNKYSQSKQPKTIFIENQDYLSKIPNSINGYQIQKIGLGNRKKIFRENGNELRYVIISPLTLSKGQFSITLTPYSAELKRKNRLYLGLSSWTNVYFEFKNRRLNYEKTENGGI